MILNERYLHDALRIIQKEFTVRTTPNEPAEHRYEEAGNGWKLRTWRDGRETVVLGLMDLNPRPNWLLSILNVGLMGGHAKRVPEPPPNLIMWFRTNLDNSLHSYIDFEK
jgi:hypothetical protein